MDVARIIILLLCFTAFLGVVIYALHPRMQFDAAAQLPLDDDTEHLRTGSANHG